MTDLRYEIGRYLKTRVADANDLQCTVWADGIIGIIDNYINGDDDLLEYVTEAGDTTEAE